MSFAESSLDVMEARARDFGAQVVAVDVRAGASSYDADIGRWRDLLAVSVVLAAPSDKDSRYRVEEVGRLLADDPAAARAGMDKARQLAERLGAALHPASTEPPRDNARSWLDQQGPPPERPWAMEWDRTVWRPDGTTSCERGELVIEAASGSMAFYGTSQQVIRGLAPPFNYTLTCKDLGRSSGCYHVAEYPAAAPPKDTLRALAREGRTLSVILRGMIAESPTLSPLDRMVAVEHAFLIGLGALGPVGAHCRGELSGRELDLALESTMEAHKPRWSWPLGLREAHARGQSIGPLLHAYYREVGSVLELNAVMRDAFGLSLVAAKILVDIACDRRRDDDLVIMLQAATRAIAAGDRDEYRAMFAALEARRQLR